jgi:hypothetical protein
MIFTLIERFKFAKDTVTFTTSWLYIGHTTFLQKHARKSNTGYSSLQFSKKFFKFERAAETLFRIHPTFERELTVDF